jgi:hypothetical protein
MPFIFLQHRARHHHPLELQGVASSVGSILLVMPLPESPTAMSRGSGTQLDTLRFPGPRQGQSKIVMTSTSPGSDATLFPPRSLPYLSPMGGAPYVMNFSSSCSP